MDEKDEITISVVVPNVEAVASVLLTFDVCDEANDFSRNYYYHVIGD